MLRAVVWVGMAFATMGTVQAATSDQATIDRGRYLVTIAGCHDCHTPGFAMNAGKVAQEKWLTGDALGWNGPWGTTYAPNLRLRLAQMDENTWIAYARALNARPPMPSWALHTMDDADLRTLWRFVRSLGVAGVPAPTALPPGVEPQGPVVRFPAPPPTG